MQFTSNLSFFFHYSGLLIRLSWTPLQVLDDKNVRRRFRASNYQSTTRVKPFICTMPMRLDDGWNQIQFNLSDFTRRAYGTNYIETLRVEVDSLHISREVSYEWRERLRGSMHLVPGLSWSLTVLQHALANNPYVLNAPPTTSCAARLIRL